jgi:hypothetical protein
MCSMRCGRSDGCSGCLCWLGDKCRVLGGILQLTFLQTLQHMLACGLQHCAADAFTLFGPEQPDVAARPELVASYWLV